MMRVFSMVPAHYGCVTGSLTAIVARFQPRLPLPSQGSVSVGKHTFTEVENGGIQSLAQSNLLRSGSVEEFSMRYFLAAFVLVAFGASAQSQTAGVKAQCKLLEQAYKETRASGAVTHADILVGCPGYETWAETMTRKDNARAFRTAMGAKVPAEAAAFGKGGKILFQQMIARGVPPEIAMRMTTTKLFTAAARAWGQ
jgi:hypothetical protein